MSMGTVVKYLIQSNDRFWVDERLAPSSGSDRIGMTWEATDNQMRGRNQNIHINLFAGGDSARRALRVFERADLAAVHAFYDRGLGRIYKNYASSRAPDPRFVPWPLERWTWGGYSCPVPGVAAIFSLPASTSVCLSSPTWRVRSNLAPWSPRKS